MNQQQFEEAVKKQNQVVVNLITLHKTAISSEVILISLHTNDLTSLKLLSDHLNNNVKYHGKFFLKVEALSYILKMDNTELIDCFKKFIHPEILCYTLNTAISKKEGMLCLQKSLKEKMIKVPHMIYLLLKTSIGKHGSEDPTTQLLLMYATKRIIRYIVSDDKYNMVMITLILNKLLSELSIVDVYKLVSQISNRQVKKYCLNVVSAQYKQKLKCYRA
jgi:hypothetical protein